MTKLLRSPVTSAVLSTRVTRWAMDAVDVALMENERCRT